jgi:hypothetical protein
MAIVDAGWPNLAQAVVQRRLEMGLSVPAVLSRIGGEISRNTWEAMEKGTRKISRPRWTYVEQALDWASGSVQNVIDGHGPTPTVTYHRDAVARPETVRAKAHIPGVARTGLVFAAPAEGVAVAYDATVRTSTGSALVTEVERIKELPISADEKIALMKALIDLFEMRNAEAHRPYPTGSYSRSTHVPAQKDVDLGLVVEQGRATDDEGTG